MKKNKILLIFTMILLMIPLNTKFVSANSGSISISGPNTLKPGETGNYTLTLSASDTAFFSHNVTVSNGTVLTNQSSSVLGDGESKSTKITVSIKAGSDGTMSINANGSAATTGASPAEFAISGSMKVSVKAPAPNPTPTNPTTPSNPKPTTPTAPSKTPEQIAKEKEEAEKAAKEAEKAKAQKTPLVSEIKLFSNSVKLYNEMINEVKPEFDKWDYSYNLPKRIDKVFINVKAVDPNTVLTFDETFDFNDIEGNDYTFEVRAKLGDIEQVIKYKIIKDTSVPATVNFNGSDYTILEDELLDKHMVDSSGFKRLTFKDADDKEIAYYEMGSLKLQPVLDGNNKASWVLLDEAFKVVREVVITFDKSNRPFIIFNAPEEIASKTVQGKSYSDEAIEIQEILNSIDENITWNNAIKSWKLDSGSILYGMDDTGKEGNFYLDSEGNIGFAIVTYDEKEAIDYKMWAYISTGVAAVLAASLVSYIIVNNKQKKRVIKEV